MANDQMKAGQKSARIWTKAKLKGIHTEIRQRSNECYMKTSYRILKEAKWKFDKWAMIR